MSMSMVEPVWCTPGEPLPDDLVRVPLWWHPHEVGATDTVESPGLHPAERFRHWRQRYVMGLRITEWCCEAGAVAWPGECPWHPVRAHQPLTPGEP